MFLRKISLLRRSLAFRLAFLFTAMFLVVSFVIFFISYELTLSSMRSRTDVFLKDKVNEFSSVLAAKGIDGIREEINGESRSSGVEKVFYRLLTADGKEIMSSDLGPWREIRANVHALKRLETDVFVFENIRVHGRSDAVRVLYGTAAPGLVLQLGQSLKEEEDLYDNLKRSFTVVVGLALMLSALGGWLLAKRSLSGVERLTQTARAIAEGAMESRVPLSGRGDEIDRLSEVFNHMLERIQSLIVQMKQVTDNIAHDIKSPITRIRGAAEVALSSTTSIDEYQAMAADTIDECDRLVKTVNTMLEISETEAGVAPLSLEEVDLSAILDQACDLFQPLAEGKGLNIQSIAPPKCVFPCDRSGLQRVIVNLLDNAVKYTQSGSVAVSAEEHRNEVIISVRDTGIGISSNDMNHIFDRFFRVDKSRNLPGAGLGLSLVRAIVQKHGGQITVKSAPGNGSVFTVMLPKRDQSS